MLGNFSFGDYFKEQAITNAWGLITREFGLKPDNLLVTVYADDDEAAGLWRKIAGFPEERIIRIGTSDNFWQMGDTGPCGPCSEIFIDRGDAFAGGPPGSPDEDGDRFLEFWNLVFMQYDQVAPGDRRALPRPSIDTGMGLERMAAILQGVPTIYETDLFRALIDATAHALSRAPEPATLSSYKVVSDHLRSTAFLIADGVLPSNEGRGYVLRRDHAPGHAPPRTARRPRAGDVQARPDAGARDGPGLSRAVARREPDLRDPAPGGDPLPPHPRARPRDPRCRDPRPRRRAEPERRDRLHPLRHLRLSPST